MNDGLIEALKKIALKYDGSRGGSISENDMRVIANEALQSVGVSVFITWTDKDFARIAIGTTESAQ